MSLRTISAAISAETVRDLVISHLHAIRLLYPNEEVAEFKFNIEALNNETVLPFTMKVHKDKEVKIIRHEGNTLAA